MSRPLILDVEPETAGSGAGSPPVHEEHVIDDSEPENVRIDEPDDFAVDDDREIEEEEYITDTTSVISLLMETGREGLMSGEISETYSSCNSPIVAEKKMAYKFDGLGGVFKKEWNLEEGTGIEFCWYHVQLNPRRDLKLEDVVLYLIRILKPLVRLPDILSLVTDGSFCGQVDTALVFRLNLPGPTSSEFVSRIAARIATNSLITIALGEIRRVDFSMMKSMKSELLGIQIPNLQWGSQETRARLKNLLDVYPYLEVNNTVPKSVFRLVVHVVDAHLDQIRDRVTELETKLDSIEIKLDKGDFAFKKEMLDDRTLQNMNMNLQHLIQAIALGEHVFQRESYFSEKRFPNLDLSDLKEISGRFRRLKENAEFATNRVKAILANLNSFQADLDRRQAEQINRKLYYISIFSGVFLPSSIITGAFGMNVRGVPWTKPNGANGFLIVMTVSAAVLLIALVIFFTPKLYARVRTRGGRL